MLSSGANDPAANGAGAAGYANVSGYNLVHPPIMYASVNNNSGCNSVHHQDYGYGLAVAAAAAAAAGLSYPAAGGVSSSGGVGSIASPSTTFVSSSSSSNLVYHPVAVKKFWEHPSLPHLPPTLPSLHPAPTLAPIKKSDAATAAGVLPSPATTSSNITRINNNNNNNHNNNGQTGSKQQNRPSASSTSGLSGTSGGSHGKKRKRVATVAQRRAANIRERRRMFNLNEAFDKLRRKVPTFAYEKRLSRIETLRLAITYISFMDQVVRNETKASSSTSAAAGGGNGGGGGVGGGSGATTNNPASSSAAMAVIHHHHHHHHPHQAEPMEDDADMESYGHRQSSPW